MSGEALDSFLAQYGKHFYPQLSKKNQTAPFKDHPQLPTLVDVLSRKHQHHLYLNLHFPNKLREYFLEAFLTHLTQDNIPHPLRNAELVYLNIDNFNLPIARQMTLENELQKLRETLESNHKYLLFALDNTDIFQRETKAHDDGFLRKQFTILLNHPKCRFIILGDGKKANLANSFMTQFVDIDLKISSKNDIFVILSQQRLELEQFHHIIIPDEILTQAYALAQRYLSNHESLEKTLLLLDSSAARASALDRIDNPQGKPILTSQILYQVLSAWTHIPATCLPIDKFKLSDFIHEMHHHIYGQDPALHLIGTELLQSYASLQLRTQPFGRFLFLGPQQTGKKTLVHTIADYLFKQQNALFIASTISPQVTSLLAVKFQQSGTKQFCSLQHIIQSIPYAMIMIEKIEQLSTPILDNLQEILSTGCLHDDNGQPCYFQQATIILTSHFCPERLLQLSKQYAPEDEAQHLDFLDLLVREQKTMSIHPAQHLSPQELVEEIKPTLIKQLPLAIYRHVHIVPFLPLNKHAIEKIMHAKLKTLANILEAQHHIEFGYAPEVVHYLTHLALGKGYAETHMADIEKAVKQLYFAVEQALLLNANENKNRPNQLFLQLNETGQMLRCDWLMLGAMRQHTT